MMKNTKKAFTLVELIVVITILAILGTIAFISLQGYSGEARDSKRLSNINDLIKKVNIEVSKGTAISSLLTTNVTNGTGSRTINTASGVANQGTVNFAGVKENAADFQDTINNIAQPYPTAYAVGGTGSGAYKFMQIATINEAQNVARVVGNYYKMDSGDSVGLIGANNDATSTIVEDGGATLPYPIN